MMRSHLLRSVFLPSALRALPRVVAPSLSATGRRQRKMIFPVLQKERFLSSAETGNQEELDFHAIADETLEAILNGAIALEDVHDDIESELAAGVLKITFENSRKSWVINKQTPNRQIWFSSPLSGPCRFELEDGVWRHTRDGTILNDLLRNELNLELDH